jgi:uncharacterized cupredoxin-like copper-binding protein
MKHMIYLMFGVLSAFLINATFTSAQTDEAVATTEETAPADDAVVSEEAVTEEATTNDDAPEGTNDGAAVVSDETVVEEGEIIIDDFGDLPVEEENVSSPTEEPEVVEVVELTNEQAPSTDVPAPAPEVTTDKDDYHPGETATIFGRFFTPLKTFFVKIFGSDENDDNYTETTETVEADEEGSFSLTYLLDSLYRPFYEVVVSDEEGATVAETWFRDGAIGTYDQCSNDDGDGYAAGGEGCKWINGNLNSNNSTYFEGDATVQRSWMRGYAPGSNHTLTFKYGTTKAGTHAYDYLTNWDFSESWITLADRCEGIPNCTGASVQETTFVIPDDPSVPPAIEPAGSPMRNMVMRGGTITGISAPVIVSGSYAGDSETQIVVSFTVDPVDGANDMCTASGPGSACDVAFWFGGHVAKTSEWSAHNQTTGAGFISGSPYHVQLAEEDGTSIGNRDNQMQSNTLPSQIIIRKVTDPVSDPQIFSFTKTGNGNGYSNFTLTGGNSNSQTVTPKNNQNTYIITEGAVPQWNLTSIVCQDNSSVSTTSVNVQNRQVTIVLDTESSSIVDCTFTNTKQVKGTLVVQKTTLPAGDPTQFSVTASGSGTITGGGAGIITDATDKVYEVTAGTYSVAETVPTGWVKTGDTCQNVVVTAGATSTCTITNTKKGHIIVDKVTNPGGDTQSFSFTTTGAGYSGFSLTDAAQPNDQEVVPGKYSVAETLPAGWVQTSAVCDSGETIADLDVEAGETVTCTFTNTKNGSITIEKQVVGADADFTFTGDVAGTLGDNETATVNVAPGTYTSTEAANAAYALTSIVCDDGNSTGNLETRTATFNVAAGENVKCVFTNSELPTLEIRKTVVNDNGGTKVANDFQGEIDDVNQAWSTPKTLTPGAHTASEVTLAGYTASAWGTDCAADGSVTLAYGDHKVCTITNDDIAPKLHLRKVVVNDNGGTKTVADFTLTADGTGSNDLSGTSPVDSTGTLLADTWALSETNVPGYTAGAWSCVGGTQNGVNITVGIGGEATCTITNDDQAGQLKIVKNTVGGDGTFNFTVTGPTASTPSIATVANTGTTGFVAVNAGAYSVAETVPAGWDLTSAVCDSGTPANFSVPNGGSVTCTFTNTKRGHVIIQKNAIPDSNTQAFTFNNNFGNGNPATFNLTDTTAAGLPNYDAEVIPGKFAVTEDAVAGWELASTTCDQGETVNDIDVAPGETVTCTFTNQKLAKITLVKNTIGGNGEFSFGKTGAGFAGTTTLTTVAGTASQTFENLDPDNTYSITEVVPAGWDLTSASCSNGDPVSAITPNAGEEITCTFTNVKRGHIIVDKITDPKGDPQSFNFTTNAGSNFALTDEAEPHDSGAIIPGTYSVAETVPPGWDLTSATCDDGSAPGAISLQAGETVTCTFNNQKDANIIVVKQTLPDGDTQSFDFTASYDNDGFALTDGQQNDSGDLNPGTYSVEETPESGWDLTSATCSDGSDIDEIELSAGETVTCTFTNTKRGTIELEKQTYPNGSPIEFAFTGDIEGSLADGDDTSVEVIPGTYDTTETVLDGWTLADITCSDENSVGNEETGVATYNVEPGETVRCTYTNVKDPLIEITGDGVNAVGDEHTFTIFIGQNADVGGAISPVNGVKPTVTFDPNTVDITENTCATTGTVNGECTVTFNSDTAGVFKGHATLTLTIGGVEYTIETDGEGENSGDAKKTYVDARIKIGDTATNNVGEPHTFTVLVEENDGTGWAPAEGEKVDFTLENDTTGDADFTGDDFCTTDANGECTVTINSANPGTVDIHAKSGVEVGGLTLDRETDGTGDNSKDATKTYEAGKIIVKKVTVGGDGDFTFTADYDANGFVLSNGEEDNSGWIATGTHSVSETVLEGWDLTSTVCESSDEDNEIASAISLQNGEIVTCTFTNTKRAKITVVKDAQPNDAQNFAFSGTLGTFTLDDDAGVSDPVDPLDQYENSKVFANVVPGTVTVTETQPNQYWTLKSATCVVTGTSNVVTSNLVGGALTLTLAPGADVTCTFVNEKLAPTRTQGFWSTHTAFTNSVFQNKFMPNGMLIGSTTITKGYIFNELLAGKSQLYGAWYSNIAKKTDGKQRTALEKARMQLLQQLVTAKLNCAEFGCPASVKAMIDAADAVYAGNSAATILTSAGLLDQYNNSGDSIIVGNTGKATPKTSKDYANLVFWNNP